MMEHLTEPDYWLVLYSNWCTLISNSDVLPVATECVTSLIKRRVMKSTARVLTPPPQPPPPQALQ